MLPTVENRLEKNVFASKSRILTKGVLIAQLAMTVATKHTVSLRQQLNVHT
jgi:hypothetical protein